jgi:hypothetical protein
MTIRRRERGYATREDALAAAKKEIDSLLSAKKNKSEKDEK